MPLSEPEQDSGVCPSMNARSRHPVSSSQPHRCAYNCFFKARSLHQSQVTKPPQPAAPVAAGVDQPMNPPASALAACAVFPASPVPLGTRQVAIKGQVSAAQQTRLPSGRQQAPFSLSVFSLKDPGVLLFSNAFTTKVPPVRTATRPHGEKCS